jgi:hypothetical protein
MNFLLFSSLRSFSSSSGITNLFLELSSSFHHFIELSLIFHIVSWFKNWRFWFVNIFKKYNLNFQFLNQETIWKIKDNSMKWWKLELSSRKRLVMPLLEEKDLKEENKRKFIKLKLLMTKNWRPSLKNSVSSHSRESMKLICLKMIKLLWISKDLKLWLHYKTILSLLLENQRLNPSKICYLIFYNILDPNNWMSWKKFLPLPTEKPEKLMKLKMKMKKSPT